MPAGRVHGGARLRGDTDFSLTTEFDRWDTDGVRFVFGYDARPTSSKPPSAKARRSTTSS